MIKFIKRNFQYIIFSFFFVSISGWLLEILYSLILRQKFVLPGTLSEPWCPIYGVTFVVVLLFLRKKDSKLLNFIKIFLIASIIEYISSYISGEIFHNVIWDYSDHFLNINGRICLEMSLTFALLGLLVFYYFEPKLRRIYIKLKYNINSINLLFILTFVLDILINIFIV